jgi:RNase P/RNase MRP subunit p30
MGLTNREMSEVKSESSGSGLFHSVGNVQLRHLERMFSEAVAKKKVRLVFSLCAQFVHDCWALMVICALTALASE